MGFEPTTLRDLVGCSNHRAIRDSMESKGQFMGLDWNRITRLHSLAHMNSLTASRCHIKAHIKAYQDATNQPPKPRDAVPVETHKLTLALHRVSNSSVVRASD